MFACRTTYLAARICTVLVAVASAAALASCSGPAEPAAKGAAAKTSPARDGSAACRLLGAGNQLAMVQENLAQAQTLMPGDTGITIDALRPVDHVAPDDLEATLVKIEDMINDIGAYRDDGISPANLPSERKLMPALVQQVVRYCNSRGYHVSVSAAEKSAASENAAADLALVRRAAQKVAKGSAAVRTIITGNVGAQQVRVSIAGTYDFVTRTGTFVLSMSVPRTKVVRFPERLLPHYAYATGFTGLPDSTWIAARRDGLQSHYLYRTPANQPDDLLAWISTAESMRHVDDTEGTRHYRGLLRLSALGAHHSATVRSQLDQITEQVGDMIRTADVWVDNDGRLARLDLGFSTPGAKPVFIKSSTTFSRFGVPVHVTKPATSVSLPTPGGAVFG